MSKIILLDDEPNLLTIYVGKLVEFGVAREDILTFDSPHDAIKTLKENLSEVGTFITDYSMWDYFGDDVIKNLKPTAPSVNFILMSSASVADKARVVGARFWQKTWDLDELHHLIKNPPKPK